MGDRPLHLTPLLPAEVGGGPLLRLRPRGPSGPRQGSLFRPAARRLKAPLVRSANLGVSKTRSGSPVTVVSWALSASFPMPRATMEAPLWRIFAAGLAAYSYVSQMVGDRDAVVHLGVSKALSVGDDEDDGGDAAGAGAAVGLEGVLLHVGEGLLQVRLPVQPGDAVH